MHIKPTFNSACKIYIDSIMDENVMRPSLREKNFDINPVFQAIDKYSMTKIKQRTKDQSSFQVMIKGTFNYIAIIWIHKSFIDHKDAAKYINCRE